MKFSLLFALFLSSSILVTSIRYELFAEPIYQTAMSKAVVTIVRNFYEKENAHIFILSRASRENYHPHRHLVNEILYHIQGVSYRTWSIIDSKKTYPSMYNIIIVDTYETFQDIYNQINNRAFNLSGFFLIVISEKFDTNQLRDRILKRLFTDCYNIYITNVNILVSRTEDIIDMYTYFPFNEGHCKVMDAVLYDTFEDETFAKRWVFPEKLTNFYGCPVMVITWHYPPHMIIKRLTPGRLLLDGIDGNILKIIVDKLNMTLEFDFLANYRGNIYVNGSATGALGVLLSGRGNITICAHGNILSRLTQIASSVNYFHTSAVYAVPPQSCYTSFEKIFFAVSFPAWLLILANFFVAIIVTSILKSIDRAWYEFVAGKRNRTPYFNMIAIVTGMPILSPPRRNFARTLFIFWTLGNLVIRTSYQGALFDFIQKAEERKGHLSLERLLDAGHQLYVSEDIIDWFRRYPKIRPMVNSMNRSYWEYFDEMQRPNSKTIVLTTTIQIDYYNHRNLINGRINSLPNRLFLMPQTIFYPKNSFLVKHIDLILQQCSAAGLVVHWVKNFLHSRQDTNKTPIHNPLSMEDLAGFYQLLLIPIIIAFIVFAFELTAHRIRVFNIVMDSIARK